MTIREPEASVHAAFGGYMVVLRGWEDSSGDRSESMHMCGSIEEATTRIERHIEVLENSSTDEYEKIERAANQRNSSASN